MATHEALERQFPGRRAHLKRHILHGALACFNEQGLEPTTIDQIRVRCDTSVGNIYHHFGNKDGLIAALFFCALDDQARLRATLDDATDHRIGMKGTAKVQGHRVPVLYWVMRRPIASVRQFLAW